MSRPTAARSGAAKGRRPSTMDSEDRERQRPRALGRRDDVDDGRVDGARRGEHQQLASRRVPACKPRLPARRTRPGRRRRGDRRQARDEQVRVLPPLQQQSPSQPPANVPTNPVTTTMAPNSTVASVLCTRAPVRETPASRTRRLPARTCKRHSRAPSAGKPGSSTTPGTTGRNLLLLVSPGGERAGGEGHPLPAHPPRRAADPSAAGTAAPARAPARPATKNACRHPYW